MEETPIAFKMEQVVVVLVPRDQMRAAREGTEELVYNQVSVVQTHTTQAVVVGGQIQPLVRVVRVVVEMVECPATTELTERMV
jgi:hypothetical protein